MTETQKTVEVFDYDGCPDDSAAEDMDRWFEMYDPDETFAWAATDSPVNLEEMR